MVRLNWFMLVLVPKGLRNLWEGQNTIRGEILTRLLWACVPSNLFSPFPAGFVPQSTGADPGCTLWVPETVGFCWVWWGGGCEGTGEWEEGEQQGISPLLSLCLG